LWLTDVCISMNMCVYCLYSCTANPQLALLVYHNLPLAEKVPDNWPVRECDLTCCMPSIRCQSAGGPCTIWLFLRKAQY
jgi:hypothetical protein